MMSPLVRDRSLRLALVVAVAVGVLACGACQADTSLRQHSLVGPAGATWSTKEPANDVPASPSSATSGSSSGSSSASVRTPDPSHRPTGNLDNGVMTDWHDFIAGDCVNDNGQKVAEEFPRVSCAKQHHYLVTGTASWSDTYAPGSTYPEWLEASLSGIAVCKPVQSAYTGSADMSASLFIYPDEEQFAAGDRHIVCLIDASAVTPSASPS